MTIVESRPFESQKRQKRTRLTKAPRPRTSLAVSLLLDRLASHANVVPNDKRASFFHILVLGPQNEELPTRQSVRWYVLTVSYQGRCTSAIQISDSWRSPRQLGKHLSPSLSSFLAIGSPQSHSTLALSHTRGAIRYAAIPMSLVSLHLQVSGHLKGLVHFVAPCKCNADASTSLPHATHGKRIPFSTSSLTQHP